MLSLHVCRAVSSELCLILFLGQHGSIVISLSHNYLLLREFMEPDEQLNVSFFELPDVLTWFQLPVNVPSPSPELSQNFLILPGTF